MPQLNYQDQRELPAFEGGLYDSYNVDIVTRSPGANVAQVDTITFSGTVGNTETYTVSVNGVEATYTTDASGTNQELYDGMIAALQADINIIRWVAVTGNGTTVITLTSKFPGQPFTLLEVADAGTEMAVATVTANVTGSPIPFGRAMLPGAAAGIGNLPAGATFLIMDGVSVNRAKGRPKSTMDSGFPYTGDAQYLADEAVPVLRRGRIWVLTESVVAMADPVRIRHTAGSDADETVGRFRSGAVAGETMLVDARAARWITPGAADSLVVLEIDALIASFTADT